jgi:peptide/nickel transport system substrate-binding protein
MLRFSAVRRIAFVMALFSLVLLTLCSSVALAAEGPAKGGVLKIALDAEPSGLDSMVSSATLTWTVAWHMHETLFTTGEKGEIIPLLASGYQVSEDGLTYTVSLRKDVRFHNGKDMTVGDVLASLDRWFRVSSTGKRMNKNLEALTSDKPFELTFKLKEPDAVFIPSLSLPGGGAIVMPADIAEKAGDKPVTEYVGTGPYKFLEWKPNRHLRFVRFEEYRSNGDKINGYGGKKHAYVDELFYLFVPDKTVEAAGVEAGDFDYAYAVNTDEYERLLDTPGVQVIASEPRAWLVFPLNNKEGLCSDKRIRQAIQAALDMEPILLASRGHQDFWRMDPSLNQKETIWWSDKGKDLYNERNREKARKLLQEAGYDGTPLRFMASYEGYYNAALVAKSQLEAVGMKVDLQKFEPATESSRRKDPKVWDATVTGFTKKVDPSLNSFLRDNYPGWWSNPEVDKLKKDLARETAFEKRYAIMDRIQEIFYEDVPYIKIGDYATMRVLSDRVKGFTNKTDVFFWNVWLEKQ